jgi:hypothetical protein
LQGGQGSDLATPALLQRLGQGSESVLGLLGKNPFPDQPPRFLRWRLDDYRFTDWSERERTGAWWTSRLLHAEPARSAR